MQVKNILMFIKRYFNVFYENKFLPYNSQQINVLLKLSFALQNATLQLLLGFITNFAIS